MIITHIEYARIFSSCDKITKQINLRTEDWSMWAGLRPQEPFHWKSAGGRPDVSPSKKTDPSSLARPRCSAWKSCASWNLELLQKSSQPLTSGRVWTLNQHLVKSLKKPLKVWSYARRTSSVKQHRAANNRRASPEWRHATTRGIPSSHTDHLNLSKYQTKSL